MTAAKRARQRERKALAKAAAEKLRKPPAPKPPRPRVLPTAVRRWIDAASHCPPLSVTDDVGGDWLGTSRVIDRPARRKANRRSWRRLQLEARRDFLNHGAE